jgi:hypothetical protein
MTDRVVPLGLIVRPLLVATALALGFPGDAGAVEGSASLKSLAEASQTPADVRPTRRLPSLARALRLTGETDAATYPIWVTAAEAASGARLRLVHVTAVSVMPEASRLSITVNDRPISEAAIASGGGARTIEVAVPAAALRPGWNALRIGVDQRHRVDCSTASTFELWTEIDPARSGLVFPAGHRPERRGLTDIAGIAPDEHGRVTIRLVTGNDGEPRQVERAFRAAQALALIGGFLDPIVTMGRRGESGPGVEVILGRAAAGLDGEAANLQQIGRAHV